MKGVVKYARGEGFVELRDFEERPLATNQVKIEVKASGICGSDLHLYHDTINYNIRTPVVLGHEFSGIVVEKGSQVEDGVEIGDRVTAEPTIFNCGRCRYCLSEYYNLCEERQVMGYWHHGSFAPYCNARFVHKLPENVSFESGALTELLACCVHSVTEQAGVAAGDFVAITGPGPVGLFAALVALAEGGTVILCGTSRDRERLSLAEALGVHYSIDVEQHDAVERVRELTGGYGQTWWWNVPGQHQRCGSRWNSRVNVASTPRWDCRAFPSRSTLRRLPTGSFGSAAGSRSDGQPGSEHSG